MIAADSDETMDEIEPAESDDRPPSPTQDGAVVVVQDPERRLTRAQRDWLREHAEAALEHLGARGEVTVRVIGDAAMCTAHERFIGFTHPTDVLTFDFRDEPASSGEDPGPLETDVLVCLDEAERNAADAEHDAMRELLLYVVHGVLHCLGHDDRDEAQARAMHAKEDEVLGAIGVGAIYRAGESAGSEKETQA